MEKYKYSLFVATPFSQEDMKQFSEKRIRKRKEEEEARDRGGSKKDVSAVASGRVSVSFSARKDDPLPITKQS